MNANRQNRFPVFCCLLLMLSLAACSPLISGFNLEAYKFATDLKARSLQLVALSNQPYSAHKDTALKLRTDIDSAYEFTRGVANNSETARQWGLIRDPNGHLMGGYLRRWQNAKNQRMSAFFITEATGEISKSFDYLICLEANKKIAASCSDQIIFQQQ